jgi:hypothetical protein
MNSANDDGKIVYLFYRKLKLNSVLNVAVNGECI